MIPVGSTGYIVGVYSHFLMWSVPDANTGSNSELNTDTLSRLDTSTLPVLPLPPAPTPTPQPYGGP